MPIYAGPRRPLPRVVVQIEGSGGSLWFSDGRYVDAAAGIVADASIGKRISFERKANAAFWRGRGRAVAGVGAVELVNSDGHLDYLLTDTRRDQVARIYIGTEDQPVSAMTLAARAIVERVDTVGESAIRFVLGDATRELEKPFQTSLIPSGTYAGQPYPVVLGYCLSVPALHTEAPTLRFCIHDSATSGQALSLIQWVYDSGVTLTVGTQWNAYNTAPSFGFALNQATAGRITSNAVGPGTQTGFNNANLPQIIEYMLVTRLGWSSGRVDLAALNSIQTEMGVVRFGRFVSGPATYAGLMDEFADSIGGWWSIDSGGVVRMDRLRMPSGSPVVSLDRTRLAGEIQVEFDAAPGLSDAVLGARNWHVLSESEQAGSVRDTAAGVDMRKTYRARSTFSVHSIYQRNQAGSSAGEDAAGMPTLFSNLSSTAAEALKRAPLFNGPRWFYRVPALLDASQAATLAIGSVVELTHPRFALESGRLLRVVGVQGEIGDGRVELTLWGDGPEIEES